LTVEIAGLRERIADLIEARRQADHTITDLRLRLDAETKDRREQLNVANRRADTERTRAERAELRIAELMMPWWRRWFR
jgi:hypothetical protein